MLKPQKDIDDERADSDEIYTLAAREFYMKRPASQEFENICYPTYISEYHHTNATSVPKYGKVSNTLDNRVVYKRAKALIPRTHFLTALDGEQFYYQQLLMKVPFHDDNMFLSEDNETRTFKEECYKRGIFHDEDPLDISFKEMKEQNFDGLSIAKVARQMLIQDIAPMSSIKDKLDSMDYGEEIPFEENDELTEYPTVNIIEDEEDEDTRKDINRILHVNRKKILMESQDLNKRIQ